MPSNVSQKYGIRLGVLGGKRKGTHDGIGRCTLAICCAKPSQNGLEILRSNSNVCALAPSLQAGSRKAGGVNWLESHRLESRRLVGHRLDSAFVNNI